MPTALSSARPPGSLPRPGVARRRILETSFRLFYERGIRAVGVDAIITRSGVAKATFYRHFPAKDDLVLAYLDRVDGLWRAHLAKAASAAGQDPADQLVGLFDALSTTSRREGYRGCAFLNAAAESPPGTAVHDRTVAHKRAVLAWVRDLATRAGVRDPDGLARSLTVLLDGGLASGALDASPAAPAAAAAAARVLVDAAPRLGGEHPSPAGPADLRPAAAPASPGRTPPR